MLKRPAIFRRLDRWGIWLGLAVSILTVLAVVWGFSAAWDGKADKPTVEKLQIQVDKNATHIEDYGSDMKGIKSDIRTMRDNQERWMEAVGIPPIRPPHKG